MYAVYDHNHQSSLDAEDRRVGVRLGFFASPKEAIKFAKLAREKKGDSRVTVTDTVTGRTLFGPGPEGKFTGKDALAALRPTERRLAKDLALPALSREEMQLP
jgi:hypothetical protein